MYYMPGSTRPALVVAAARILDTPALKKSDTPVQSSLSSCCYGGRLLSLPCAEPTYRFPVLVTRRRALPAPAPHTAVHTCARERLGRGEEEICHMGPTNYFKGKC